MFSTIWLINGTLTGTIISGQSGPESNGNKGVLCILQSPWVGPHYQMKLEVLPWTSNDLFFSEIWNIKLEFFK